VLDICLLGCGGTQPLPGRRLSSLLVRHGGRLVLIDCGEGTQIAVRERGWGLRNLSLILLTHMHGDHVLGLPGLLLTLAFTGKGENERLTICGPEPLIEVLQGLLVVAPRLPFPLDLVVLAGGESFSLEELPGLGISCAAVEHDVPCLAYALDLPRAPRFSAARAEQLGVPRQAWKALQQGRPWLAGGREVLPAQVLGPPRRGLRLVLATDLRPSPALTAFARGAGGGPDLLIADAMYASPEQMPRRWQPQHLTFAEAATLAREAEARLLWLTHFGPALQDPVAGLPYATSIFSQTVAGYDGLTISLAFDQDSEDQTEPAPQAEGRPSA
jgi:ribonuclease Z